jgi:hypothetical protein
MKTQSWEERPVRPPEPSPIIAGIAKVLHERLEHEVDEPLPERWVELIHYLNEKERAALITKPPRKSALRRHCS